MGKTLLIISHMGRSDVLKRGFQHTILNHLGHVSKRRADRTLALARVPAGGRWRDCRLQGRQRIKGSSKEVGTAGRSWACTVIPLLTETVT